jgi:hypothetical protein
MHFTNGIVVSMNIGACGYNDNHNSSNFSAPRVETDTVEIAVWIDSPNHARTGEWITKEFFPDAEEGGASVVGYVTMKEFEETLPRIINNQL